MTSACAAWAVSAWARGAGTFPNFYGVLEAGSAEHLPLCTDHSLQNHLININGMLENDTLIG